MNRKDIFLIDCGSSRVPEIQSVVEAEGHRVRKVAMAYAAALDYSGADGLIISGGACLFTDPLDGADLQENFSFLASRHLPPVLGICLGAQALALWDGGKVFLGPPVRRLEAITLRQPHPLFNNIAERPGTVIEMLEDHTEGLRLPPGWTMLADSRHYAVEAMANDRLRRYGVQFHPESTQGHGHQLIRNFLDMCQ
jgi:GMP synthase-like glutamine amidotransferase